MFEAINQIISNANKLNAVHLKVEVFTDKSVSDGIVNYITKIQLFEYGKDGLGVLLQEYRPFTISEKKRKGDRYKVTTLKDTGKFHNSFKVKVDGRGDAYVVANDLHDLTDSSRYGIDILTLSDDGWNKEIRKKAIEVARRYVLETLFS